MGITVMCSSFYMWYKKTEYFPLGMKEVRSLLVARGLFGFFGVFGMYCKSYHLTQRATWGSVTCLSSLHTASFVKVHATLLLR
jgi:hypothetical protein